MAQTKRGTPRGGDLRIAEGFLQARGEGHCEGAPRPAWDLLESSCFIDPETRQARAYQHDQNHDGRRASVQAQAEPADDRGRHCDRAAGAHSAQDASASGRVISTTWRVVFFEREDLPWRDGSCAAIVSSSKNP